MKAVVDYSYMLNEFTGGLVSAIDETLIKKNCAKSMSNIDFRAGSLQVVKGMTKYFATNLPSAVIDSVVWIQPIFDSMYTGMHFYVIGSFEGEDVFLNWDAEDGSYTVLDASLISSNFYDYPYGSVQFTNKDGDKVLIFGNGSDNTLIANIDTVAKMKHDGAASTASGTNVAPKGKCFALHHDRIWIAGRGDGLNEDLLCFSTSNANGIDPEDWTAPTSELEKNQHGGEIQVYSYDGGIINGLHVIFDDVVIFKTCNIFKISGTTPDDYQLSQVYSAKGTIVGKSIVNAGDKAYFLSEDGIYVYNGVSVDLISQNVTNIIKNNVDERYVCAAYHDSKYILNLCGDIILEYDEITKSFSYRYINVTLVNFVNFKNDLLCCIEEDINLYKYDEGTKYSTSNILANWQSGSTDLGYPDSKKSITAMYVNGSSSGDIKFTITTEKGAKFKQVNLGSTGGITKVKLKNKGRSFSFKVENVNGSTFNIKSIKFLIDIDPD